MKHGLISGAMKEAFVDYIVMPNLIAASPGGFIGWPGIKQLTRHIVMKAIGPIFDEGQRHYNFGVIRVEELEKNDEYKQDMEALRKVEESGVSLEEDPKAKEAYENFKKKSGELIRLRAGRKPPK